MRLLAVLALIVEAAARMAADVQCPSGSPRALRDNDPPRSDAALASSLRERKTYRPWPHLLQGRMRLNGVLRPSALANFHVLGQG
jgi:hypothetical protein